MGRLDGGLCRLPSDAEGSVEVEHRCITLPLGLDGAKGKPGSLRVGIRALDGAPCGERKCYTGVLQLLLACGNHTGGEPSGVNL